MVASFWSVVHLPSLILPKKVVEWEVVSIQGKEQGNVVEVQGYDVVYLFVAVSI